MDDQSRPPSRLVPARPDMRDAQRSGFLPRVPWRYIGVSLAIVGLVVTGYALRQRQRAAELRVALRETHATELATDRASYEAALVKLGELVHAAAEAPTTSYVAPELQLETLRDSRGLYLRIPLAQAKTPAQIRAAALQMDPDWIPSCLGLDPRTARELYEIGAFLLPAFVAHLDDENVMKLRVRQDTLQRRISKDLPGLRADMKARWFMLVLQEGDSRSRDPVRVFIWDLHEHTLLLRARVRAQGILLTSRILSQSLEKKPNAASGPSEGGAAAANDCSIASELKRTVRAAQSPTPDP